MGRASAFSDEQIIDTLRRDFIPVVGDDWYTRRRQDDEGRFFRAMSDQGPRKGTTATRQGLYAFTADGTLLAYKNAGNSAEATREQLRKALAEWRKLPPDRTRPGAVTVPERFDPDPRYSRAKPPGGATLRQYSRILDRADGGFKVGSCGTPGGDKAGRDVVWMTAAEVRALAPAGAKVGDVVPLPAAVKERLVRFHLLDNTRGEPPAWRPNEVRRAAFSLTVTAVDGDAVTLQLAGSALLSDGPDPAQSGRGFEVRVVGSVTVTGGKLTAFEAVALGEHWGEAGANSGSRPGRSLLGIAFGLADGSRSLDGIPPQGVRDRDDYFGGR